jgi:hypothetical protein
MPVHIYNMQGICCASVSNANAYEVFLPPAGVYFSRAVKLPGSDFIKRTRK